MSNIRPPKSWGRRRPSAG